MAATWTQGAIGIWLLLSPWLLQFSDISLAKWSSALCGIVLILVSAWQLFAEKSEPRL